MPLFLPQTSADPDGRKRGQDPVGHVCCCCFPGCVNRRAVKKTILTCFLEHLITGLELRGQDRRKWLDSLWASASSSPSPGISGKLRWWAALCSGDVWGRGQGALGGFSTRISLWRAGVRPSHSCCMVAAVTWSPQESYVLVVTLQTAFGLLFCQEGKTYLCSLHFIFVVLVRAKQAPWR